MFSLCYLPTAGRLTLTVIKCRNLKAMDITGYSGMLSLFGSIILFIILDRHIFHCQQSHYKSFFKIFRPEQTRNKESSTKSRLTSTFSVGRSVRQGVTHLRRKTLEKKENVH